MPKKRKTYHQCETCHGLGYVEYKDKSKTTEIIKKRCIECGGSGYIPQTIKSKL